MLYGLYLSAQGADAQAMRQDVIANNLANASTTAFKRDLAVFQAHLPLDVEEGDNRPLPGNVNEHTGGLTLAGILTDHSTGALDRTGGELDVGLAGPGFLRVTDGKQQFLTRDGRLGIDGQGNLATISGYKVLGAGGGPLAVAPDGGKINIGADGALTQGAEPLGRLDLVEPADYLSLNRVGDLLFTAGDGKVVPATNELQVKQGYLEVSGTRPVNEMTDLIESSRMLEANVNMIKYQDESLGRLLDSLARR